MRLQEAIETHPKVRILRVIDSDADQKSEWDVEIADAPVLSQEEGFFILKAKNILPDGTIRDCYIDVSMPERISDYVYQLQGASLDVRYHHEFEGEVVCAVPISSFGVYELFYSKTKPEVGIEVLQDGLRSSAEKAAIAEDLGYIFRDERRFREAAEAFELAVQQGASSYFIYGELAGCYDETGNKELADKYRKLFENPPGAA
jgi:hypothetical protein